MYRTPLLSQIFNELVEVERIELSSKRFPRGAVQLVETITPPKGELASRG